MTMPEYIEREALKKRLEDFSKWCKDGRKQGVDFVLDCPLPDIPTADVVEVRHGEWITAGTGITERVVCSVCKSDKGSFMKPPFCNQCGAKMDGDE